MRRIVLIAYNVRSTYNVGSLLRTADGLGINKVYLSGYTPYPSAPKDDRLPHLRSKITASIHKTALGAENSVTWEYGADLATLINFLKDQDFKILALEQTATARKIIDYSPPEKIALIVGNEVSGLDCQILNQADDHLQIPMQGAKESFNVAVAAAIALYHLKYIA